MPYPYPVLTTLLAQGRQDITARGIGADGLLRFSVLGMFSDLIAGYLFLHYDYQDWIAIQSNPWTATDEYADGWGALKGVYRKPAIAAVLTAAGTGLVAATLIPAGTGFARQDGFKYTSTTDVYAASDGTASVTIQATVTGPNGNAVAGTALTITGSVPGAPANAFTVSAQVTSGVDQETDTAFKTRYLQAYRDPPQGGALSDYIEWTLAIPGVTRVWVKPNAHGGGTVAVFPMLDNAETAYSGFPQGTDGTATAETRDTHATGDQLQIANALYMKQPVTALVYAQSPVNLPVAFTITNLGINNTGANQTAIEAALKDMFLRLGNVGGTLNPDTGASYPEIDPSSWYTAIASVVGNGQFSVPSPSAAIIPGNSQLPTLGSITFAS